MIEALLWCKYLAEVLILERIRMNPSYLKETIHRDIPKNYDFLDTPVCRGRVPVDSVALLRNE